MHMFSGFSPAFFERYHQLVPRSEPRQEYEQREQLYEAYHHLNHALMFGVSGFSSLASVCPALTKLTPAAIQGSYKSGAISLLRGLLSWADEQRLP